MNTDELREVIWEELFRGKAAKSIHEVAALTATDATDVRAAVDHEWFKVTGDLVSIAYAGGHRDGRER